MLAITHPPILQFEENKEGMKKNHLESHMLETCLVVKVKFLINWDYVGDSQIFCLEYTYNFH